MITESRDPNTGYRRFEVNTTRPDLLRVQLDKCKYVKDKKESGSVANYDISYQGQDLTAMATETRLILWGKNRYSMLDFIECIKGNEYTGSAWIYDDSLRSDYQNTK